MAQSRRTFLGTAIAAGSLAASCGQSSSPKQQTAARKVTVPTLLEIAPDGPELKAGLIGCGGRGRGAAVQYIQAGPNCRITALGDTFPDRIAEARKVLSEQGGQEVPESSCFVGFDAFQKVIDSGVDVIILATPPHFRPEHLAAAIAAGKHVFAEKPLAVDPVGIRSVIESAGQARTKNLCIVTGTQRRHQKQYIETWRRVAEGMIGDIVAARCYWNMSQLWYRERQQGWTDMEWMIRDWVNWCWLSGDHIVEQHVHNIDVINWFTGKLPVSGVAFGSRQRRVTGDQYDNFAVDFTYEGGLHCMSMSRQINGCANNVSEFIVGTNGSTNCMDTIWAPDGSVLWKFEVREGEKEPNNPYLQEHIDLVTAIRTGEIINEAKTTAESTMCAILGRQSAYTGKEQVWQEMMDSEMRLGPTEYTMSNIGATAVIPVPGAEKNEG